MLSTVQSLIDRAKAAADMHDDFVTESQWLAWVNVEHRAFLYFLARSGYILRVASTDIVANGQGEYVLVDEPLAIIGVWEQTSDGRMRPLRYNNLIEGTRQMGDGAGPDRGAAKEFVVTWEGEDDPSAAFRVNFWPEPDSGTYVVKLISAPVTLTIGSSVNYPGGWEERIVLRLARRAILKEEGDVRGIDTEIAIVESWVQEAVWNQNLSQAPTVRNVDKLERGWVSQPTWLPPVREWVFV